MKSLIKMVLKKFKYEIFRINDTRNNVVIQTVQPDIVDLRDELLVAYKGNYLYSDFTDEEIEIIQKVRKFTLTSPERIVSLINAVKYIIKNKIPGDFVECGVWKGGSMMVVAYTLAKMGVNDRNLYLYDTYEGMSTPTENDVSYNNVTAEAQLLGIEKSNEYNILCYSSLAEVQNNLNLTKYNHSKIHFVKGKVENTIPGNLPSKIALLRLDTDWYESTYHELVHLYPLLVKKGILIIDDYGHWKGCRKATDLFFQENNEYPLFTRVDYTGRLAQKV